ncbi:MAG TPA: hypothetical protein VH934_15275 [Xanthobacteraceae bacterium]|jgi:hypothetical protein
MSTEPDSSASFIAAGLLKVAHVTFGNAGGLGVLFHQVMLLHQVELQVAHGELACEADFRRLRRRRAGREHQRDPRERWKAGQPQCSTFRSAHGVSLRSLSSRLRPQGGHSPWSP